MQIQMQKFVTGLFLGLSAFLLFTPSVSAHVIVTPKQVGIAETEVFDMSVPTEKNTPTVGIKLIIPKGVTEVLPNAKPGWKIKTVKKGDTVTEIDWTGGSIPVEERDDFFFEAEAPATPTTLKWKAYQTYGDGSVVSWDHTPTANPEDDSAPPPYSETKVINDLMSQTSASQTQTSSQLPLIVSLLSLIFAVTALAVAFGKKN